MSDASHGPKTLQQAIRYFSDPKVCLDYVVSRRWPNGVTCPTCGSSRVHFLANQLRWKCSEVHPRRQFSAKVGTIFEDSPIGFDKWLPAMWLIANAKNGISSYELHRALGVTQKTAWFMLQRIRLALQTSGGKLGGPGGVVEVDETYIGGKARSMNTKRLAKAKIGRGSAYATPRAIVLGMLERGGRIRLKHVPNARSLTLLTEVMGTVRPGSGINTDELHVYGALRGRYLHEVVNHSETYVRGNVHTNGIENFWSLLKRTIRGTYVSVEPFHLFRYLDEQAFRFNERKDKEGDRGRFWTAMGGVGGRRLTYKSLTGASTPS
jgi:transposase-like protein